MSDSPSRLPVLCVLPLLAIMAGACGDEPGQTPTQPEPVEVSEEFTGTLTVNGSAVHTFTVERAGGITAQITEISTDGVRIGMSLGTWSGLACQLLIVNASAGEGTLIAGVAQSVGNFCVFVNDSSGLSAPVDYVIRVAHF